MADQDEARSQRVQQLRWDARRAAESKNPPDDGLGVFVFLLFLASVVVIIAGGAGAGGGAPVIVGGVVLFALAMGLLYLLGIRASLRRLEALLASALLRDEEPPTSMPGKP